MRDPARLVVGEGADEVRRAVGPAAWAALEVLSARSARVDGESRVAASVREVAVTLGLSKNAAHRAIRRLVDADFAAPAQDRAVVGRFLTGTYRLTIPADALRVEPISDRAPTLDRAARTRAPRRQRPTDRSVQLDLLTDAG